MYGGLVVIGLVAVGVLALAVIFRDTATPVTREVVSDTAGSVIGTDPGDPGVYTYITTGREQVDAATARAERAILGLRLTDGIGGASAGDPQLAPPALHRHTDPGYEPPLGGVVVGDVAAPAE